MTEPKTHTLDAPGAVLHYDVRSNDASTEPVLLLIGSPMGIAVGSGDPCNTQRDAQDGPPGPAAVKE